MPAGDSGWQLYALSTALHFSSTVSALPGGSGTSARHSVQPQDRDRLGESSAGRTVSSAVVHVAPLSAETSTLVTARPPPDQAKPETVTLLEPGGSTTPGRGSQIADVTGISCMVCVDQGDGIQPTTAMHRDEWRDLSSHMLRESGRT